MNSPAEIAKNYVNIGVGKTKLPIAKMLIMGILAGAFIAFGALANQVASVSISTPSVARLVGACVFTVGLVMVLVAGSELFTGNNLLVIPLLEKKITVGAMLKSWIVVYIGNFIGSLLVAMAGTYGHVYSQFDGKLAESVVKLGQSKVALTFGDAVIRGILCNILVCIAVWMSFSAKELAGKVIVTQLPVMIFVLSGFEHSIANMYYTTAGVLAASEYGLDAGALNWGTLFTKNLLPVTLGNLIGGACIVGCGYWFIYLRNANKQ